MPWTFSLEGRIERAGLSIAVAETFAILDGIAADASLKAAATRTGLSYRATWDKLARIEALLGSPAARRIKGHGTSLTPAGEALRAALDASMRRMLPLAAKESTELTAAMAALGADKGVARLTMAASHDPLLVGLARTLDWLRLDIVGSAEALGALRAGRADLAGCHFGEDASAPPAHIREALAAAGFGWLKAFGRVQGLMVAPGNPLAIGSLGDAVRARARFVNRQRGSGTRSWFDRLLARDGIDPGTIRGYADEEFTHQAVAAVIAAGRADTGLGVRAAAEKFGLDFIPLGEESYFLFLTPELQTDPQIHDLLELIRKTKATVSGYR